MIRVLGASALAVLASSALAQEDPVRMLSRGEIADIVRTVAAEAGPPGPVRSERSSFRHVGVRPGVSAGEARALVEAMFRKNGVDAAFVVLQLEPLGSPVDDWLLDRLRGGRPILVLDRLRYVFRADGIDRLLEDVRLFIVWIQERIR